MSPINVKSTAGAAMATLTDCPHNPGFLPCRARRRFAHHPRVPACLRHRNRCAPRSVAALRPRWRAIHVWSGQVPVLRYTSSLCSLLGIKSNVYTLHYTPKQPRGKSDAIQETNVVARPPHVKR
jgi:hypothetical protein